MNVFESFISISKTAQEKEADELCELLSTYVAMLKSMYLCHQRSHWESRSYGNHLLFQRLYEEVQEMADDAAEKTIGLCGYIIHGNVCFMANKVHEGNDPISASLKIEELFQELSKTLYDTLKEKDLLTLGLDDMIMSMASKSEVHIYLLKQYANSTT
jgi:DNA-binding ferritin-like protein